MSRDELIKNYWNYYLTLEKKFIQTFDYVELDKRNYSTFSNEYASLMQAIGSELNSFLKEYYPDEKRSNMAHFSERIEKDDRDIINQKITVKIDKTISLQPFGKLGSKKSNANLSWWNSFNNLKHSRVKFYIEANQQNCLEILSALFLFETRALILISRIDGGKDIFDIPSSLFIYDDHEFKYMYVGDLFAETIG